MARAFPVVAVLLVTALPAVGDEPAKPAAEPWAFRGPKRGEVPRSKFQVPCANPIDAFVQARLAKESLALAAAAGWGLLAGLALYSGVGNLALVVLAIALPERLPAFPHLRRRPALA